MFPTDHRLLQTARSVLRRAAAGGLDPAVVAVLGGTNVLLDELALRADAAWLATYAAQAERLVHEGTDLLATHTSQRRVADRDGRPTDGSRGEDQHADRTETLKVTLTRLVIDLSAGDSRDDAAVPSYLARVVDWENELYARRAPKGSEGHEAPDAPDNTFTAAAIERYLSARFSEWQQVRVSNLRMVGGGFSKTTLMIDVEALQTPRHTLVIRAETADSLLFYDGAHIDNEYRVLQLLYRSGIKVAKPLWLECDTKPFGVRFLVSAQAVGRNFGTAIRVKESLSGALLRDLMANLYAIHRTKIMPEDEPVRTSHLARWVQDETLSESTKHNVAYWKTNIDLLHLPASPIIARAIGWLTSHIPDCDEAPCLIHRDYGLHNILVENERISCILDWENATMGDPAEDLAWFINGLAGTVERQVLLDLYSDFRGSPVPEDRLRFFEVFNSLKYAVTCLQALTLFQRNADAPASLCEVGFSFMYHGTRRLNQHIALAEQTQSSAS